MPAKTPKTLVVAYDVTDWPEKEIDYLAGEAVVQGESNDDHGHARHVLLGTYEMPVDRVTGACEIAAESWEPDPEMALMVCVDGVEHATVELSDGDDRFNAEAERGALDRAYEAKESNPDAVVTVVITREGKP